MKIIVDARQGTRNLSGIGLCIKKITEAILDQGTERDEYIILPRNYMANAKNTEKRNLLEIVVGLVKNILWKQIYLPLVSAVNKADLLLCLDPVSPVFHLCPTILVIYDLTFLHREIKRNRWCLYWHVMVPLCVRRAKKVVTFAEATKQDLIRHLKIPEDKIAVTVVGHKDGLGVISDPEMQSRIKAKYSLPETFILFVGSILPKRNVKALVKAYGLFRDRGEFDHKLILAGSTDTDEYRVVREEITRLGLDDEVIFLGFVSDEDLRLLYNAASLYIYPSLSEGIGLTVLEAMACGTPVITSNTSSLPEVAGDAAILIDPTSPAEMAQAMTKVLNDRTLQEEMREKGFDRTRQFSWVQVARDILSVCEEAGAIVRVGT